MAFDGQVVALPLGQLGLTATKNMAKVEAGQLLESLNVTYDTGALRREGGAVWYNSTPIAGNPTVIGGWDWWPTWSLQRNVILTTDGKLLLEGETPGDFSGVLASGLSTSYTTIPIFVEGGAEGITKARKLFVFTGSNQVRVVAGNTIPATVVAKPPADWGSTFPTVGALHQNRLWAAGNTSDPHRLYYSTTGDHEDFQAASAGTLSVYPGEFDGINALISMKGRLIIFKRPKGIYIADVTDPNLQGWSVQRITRSVGIAGPNAWFTVDDQILFMDGNGNIHNLAAVQEFGEFSLKYVSNQFNEDIENLVRDNMNLARLQYTRTIYYAARREGWFVLSLKGSNVGNCRLVLDFNDQSRMPRFRFSKRGLTIGAVWVRRDVDGVERPLIGEANGRILKLDQGNNSINGEGYLSQFTTPLWNLDFLDPRLSNLRKLCHFLELNVEPLGNWTVNIDVFLDGRYSQTLYFNMSTQGTPIGSFILGDDALGNDRFSRRRRRMIGSGSTIQLTGYTNNPNEDFSIFQAFLYFTIGDERIVPG